MAKTPITPGQKAARARDRERFAAKLAANEAAADRALERLSAGDAVVTEGGHAYAFDDGTPVDPAIVAILLHRNAATRTADGRIVPRIDDHPSPGPAAPDTMSRDALVAQLDRAALS